MLRLVGSTAYTVKKWNIFKLIVCSVFLCFIFSDAGLSPLYSQEDGSIYYIASDEGLYRIVNLGSLTDLGQREPQAIEFRAEEYRLSHNGQQIAFWDKTGLWLSNLDNWNPQLVVTDKRQLDFRFFWMPDDTRIFFEISSLSVPYSRPIEYEALVYNLLSREVESWPWGDCNKIARQNQTAQLVMVCSTLPWTWQDNPTPTSIALQWGGEYEAFVDSDYEILVENVSSIPDISWTNQGELLAFIGGRTSSIYSNNLYISRNENVELQTVQRDVSAVTRFDLSPNGRLIAYLVSCVQDGSQNCLQVEELTTGNIVWSSENTLGLRIASDLQWYPDNTHIVILGRNPNYAPMSLWIVDLEQQTAQEYPITDDALTLTIAP